MKKNLIIFILLFVSSYTNATSKNFKGLSDDNWATQLARLYVGGEYKLVATNTFEYFRYKNEESRDGYSKIKVHEEDGSVSGMLWDYLNKKSAWKTIDYPCSLSEAKIYYYGALAFNNLANEAWGQNEQQILHFDNDKLYNINCCRIAYDYMAYIFSYLCLDYLLTEIDWYKKYNTQIEAKQIFLYYNMALELQSIITLYDTKYYNCPGGLIYAVKDIYGSVFYLALAQEPIKSLNKLQRLKKDVANFKKNRTDLFESKIDEILFDIRINKGQEGYAYTDSYIPYITSELRSMNQTTTDSLRVIQAYKLQKMFAVLSSSNNYLYTLSNKKERPKLILQNFNAMIAYSIADLYTRGANQYKDYRNTDWVELKKHLNPHDYCIQFFEATNGDDSWLLGYVISGSMREPQLKYFGHSYWSEKDAFDDLLPNAKRIFYTGLNTMELQDAEKSDVKIHRLQSLAELCMPNNSYKTNTQNLIIADLNYFCDSSSYATEKGMADLLGNFQEDKSIINYLQSLFVSQWKVMTGDTITKKSIIDLSGGTYNVLHISTHGLYDENAELFYNYIDPANANTGVNTLKSIYLALSDYNSNKYNRITANEISKLDLTNVGLVFLSACESGSGNINGQRVSSLAKSFHIAGVRNVIAFIGSISESDANAFTREFYKKLAEGFSYHDAFYQAKAMFPNFKNDVKIIMWE